MTGRHQRAADGLKQKRIDRGLSVRGLARLADVDEGTIRHAEHGGIPRPDAQLRIATVFDMRPTELWELIEDDDEEAAVA